MLPFLLVAAALAAPADAPPPDPREIVRRSVEFDTRHMILVMQYTYLERQMQRQFDSQGKEKLPERLIRTWDITQLEGSQYRRLISRNDQPLPAFEEEREKAMARHNVETRKVETPAQRDARLAEARQKIEKQRAPIREVPDAFDFKLMGEQKHEGKDCWVIEATPKPGYKPKSRNAFFFSKVRGRLLVSKSDYQWVKLDAESLDVVSFGVILARVAKGATIRVEMTRVNDEVWLPKTIDVSATARIAMVKLWRGRIETTYSNYRKFQVDSRLVE